MVKIYSFLVSIPGVLFAQFLALFGRKFTVATSAVLAMLATVTTMIVCLKSILTACVAMIAIPSWLLTAIAWFIPSNTVGVISLILSGRICKSVYLIANDKIKLITQAN